MNASTSPPTLSRRAWFRRSGGLLAGLSVLPTMASPSATRSVPRAPTPRYPDLDLVNLAGNENPFGPSRRVLMAIMRESAQSCRYPFREEVILREMVAEREGVSPEHIVLGQGCDEILALSACAFTYRGTEVISARPTYLWLSETAERRGAHVRWIDHTGTMHHDLAAMEGAMGNATRLIYVCNPDTPSGTVLPPDQIQAFCETVTPHATVFLDEVYLDLLSDFEARTQVGLVRNGLPIIIGRSFSKMHALAGHRIGYAVTTPDIAQRLEHEKMSSLNYLGVLAARESLFDHEFHAYSRKNIRAGRIAYCALLDRLGLRYTPSVANFVFHEIPVPIRTFQAEAKKSGFLVGRPFPPYENWCRLSIGTPDEMAKFGQFLEDFIHRTSTGT